MPPPAAPHSELLALEAGGNAQVAILGIVGSQPLSFTTRKLSAPPRLVIDCAETELSGTLSLQIDDGTLLRAAAQKAGERTARVVVELAADSEFEVEATGTRLDVRVSRVGPLRPAGVTLLRATPQPLPKVVALAQPPPRPPLPGPPPQQSAPRPQPRESAPAQPQPPAKTARAGVPAPPPSRVPAKTQPASEPQSIEAHRRKLPTVSLAAEHAPPPAAPRPPKAAQPSPPKAPRERPRALVVLAPPATREPAVAPRPRPAPPAPPGPLVATQGPPSAQLRARAQGRPAGPVHLGGIGYRPVGEGRVLIHVDPSAAYAVSREESAVVLTFPQASFRRATDRLPLDTQFFGGAVRRIVPVQERGEVRVRIELSRQVPFRVEPAEGSLAVQFSAPQ